MNFTHDDYTTAWICALPWEMAAAKAMLDESHSPLHQLVTDHNTYTLGRLGGHNVVIACLPSGVYGTTSATTVLSHMLPTFPSLQFGLMVGIGGGVPSKHADIRLGDVVVSMPTATSGGVIQYDYGKTLGDGKFRPTGSLNKPPQILLTAISQMRSNQLIGVRPLEEIISTLLQKNQEMRERFSRPETDWLFNSIYNHQSCHTDCLMCDQTQLVNRVPRATGEPHIHYGLVASGNQVMKDAKTRDLIAQEMDILCFEMEAAGLMDQLPCLVIRGICDYCDSHKNKQWQGYAALVAAAYARALLLVVPDRRKSDEREKEKERHWTVPFIKNRQFVGREGEITQIKGWIMQRNGPSTVAICGLSGVGKTQIALEVAYWMRERDSECSVFWVPFTSYESIEQAYMNIARIVGIHGVKSTEVKERVKAYLSQKETGRWLLIFDNADYLDTPLPTDFLPQSEQGRILFTICNPKLAAKLASSQVIHIHEPDEKTAVKILEKSLSNNGLLSSFDATVLLKQLAFLPLAIIQAAAYINKNNIGLSEYTELLQEQEPDVTGLLSEDFGDKGQYHNIPNPVVTTWLISFRRIQQLNQLAAEYLSFMACIHPRDIPQSLLPQPISQEKKIEAINLLKVLSFISEQGGDHTLSLHRSVYLATRKWLRKNQQFGLQVSKAADQLSNVFPDNNHTNQELWRQYLPHALSLIGEDIFPQERYIHLVQKIARCLTSDGRYNEAAVLFENIMQVQKQRSGVTNPLTLFIMADLASTLWNQGRLKQAEELGVQVMELRKQVLGPEHPETLTSMNNLATVYKAQGRWKQAEELEVQVIEIRQRVIGSEHPDTLTSINNLALSYHHLGRWKEAAELGSQVIEIRKQVLGPEHPDTLTSMNNLALTYEHMGRWKAAEVLGSQVIEISKQVLGPEHPNTLTSMSNLATVYKTQGLWKQAEELELQVIEVRKRVIGSEHPETLVSMNNLAFTYKRLGRWKEAEELEMQVIKVRKQVLGPEHPDTLTSMNNLACTWNYLGKAQDALALMEKCVELRSKILGLDHPWTISSCHIVRDWKNLDNPLLNKHPRATDQAKSDQPPQQPPDNQLIKPLQRQKGAITPSKLFLEYHPLFIASRRASPTPRGQDLQELD